MTIHELIKSWDGCTNLDDEIAFVYWTEENIRDTCKDLDIPVTLTQIKKAIAVIDAYLENDVEVDMTLIFQDAGIIE